MPSCSQPQRLYPPIIQGIPSFHPGVVQVYSRSLKQFATLYNPHLIYQILYIVLFNQLVFKYNDG